MKSGRRPAREFLSASLFILLAAAAPVTAAPVRLLVWRQGPATQQDQDALAAADGLAGVEALGLNQDSPLVRRPLADGSLPRELLLPRSDAAAAALARALHQDLILLPSGFGPAAGAPVLVDSASALAQCCDAGRDAIALRGWISSAVAALGGSHADAAVLSRRAAFWMERRRPAVAAVYYSDAAAQAPLNADSWRGLADACLECGRLRPAARAVKTARSLKPADPAILLTAARVEAAGNHLSAALALAGQASAAPAVSPALRRALGGFYLEQGLHGPAGREFRAAMGLPASGAPSALEWIAALRRTVQSDPQLQPASPLLDFGWRQVLARLLQDGAAVQQGQGVRQDFDQALSDCADLALGLRTNGVPGREAPAPDLDAAHSLVYALIAQSTSACAAALRVPDARALGEALNLLADTQAELEHVRTDIGR